MKYLLALLFMLFTCTTHAQIDSTRMTNTIDSICFTEQQVQDISYTIDSLIIKDSVNQVIISEQDGVITSQSQYMRLDSLEIMFLNENVKFLEGNINDYIKINQQLKPKWYEKPGLYFILGIVTTTAIANYVVVTVR